METMVGIHTSLPRIRELENEMTIVKFLVKASRGKEKFWSGQLAHVQAKQSVTQTKSLKPFSSMG
jgi:hypothetical protein